jgi:hypothetical protein
MRDIESIVRDIAKLKYKIHQDDMLQVSEEAFFRSEMNRIKLQELQNELLKAQTALKD